MDHHVSSNEIPTTMLTETPRMKGRKMPLEPQNHDAENSALLREQLRLGLTIVSEIAVYRATDWVTSVHATDIDNDGDTEVIFGSRDGIIRVLTRNGAIKWKRSIDSQWRRWVGAVSGLAYPGNKACVVAGARDGSINAFDKTGETLWRASATDVIRQILVGDVNHDGRIEVIAASEDFWVYAFDYETGREVWRCPTQGWVRTIYLCDIDGDDEIEVLAGVGDKSLYIISGRSGQIKQTHAVKQKIHAIYAHDVDHDGAIEILVGTNGKDLYALKPNGQEKWRMHPSPENRVTSLDVVDINNDGHNEIIVASEDMHIYILDDQGKLLWRHYLGYCPLNIQAQDIDCDGLIEILVGAQDNGLHVLHIDLAEELKGLHNNILSCYKRLSTSSSISSLLSQTENALLQDIIQESTHERPVTIRQLKHVLRQRQYTDALSLLLRLKQQNVQPLWKNSKSVGYVRSLCFGNIVGDAQLEVIIGTDEGEIQVLSASGKLIWSRPLPDQRIVMLQMGDLDGDGESEIIACTYNKRVYVLNNRGKFSGKPMQEWVTCIYVSRFLRDNQPCTEVVMGSRDNKITIYNSLLEELESIPTPQGIKMICTYDLNNNGIPEIIAGTFNEYVYVYSRSGEKLWEYRIWDRVSIIRVMDIDNDGLPEIVVGSEDRNIHVLDVNGHLKWRYYTNHRVLDVDMRDVDQDGQVEVLVGCGNGYMYVLNGQGDLLWRYKVNDRIRVAQAEDVNKDGNIEILLGSEDRVYLLQPVQQLWIEQQIEQCWLALLGKRSVKECLLALRQHSDAHLRAFALRKLATTHELSEDDIKYLDAIIMESSREERIACTEVIPLLYQTYPLHTLQLLKQLSVDPVEEVQLALIQSLPALTEIDPLIGFEWFKRFVHHRDRWLKRTAIRKLFQLIPTFPAHIFPLLITTSQQETIWIQQESARALAYYCELYPSELIICASTLLLTKMQPPVFQQIAYSSNNSLVQRLFQSLVDLHIDLQSGIFAARLEVVVQTLGETRALARGEENWQIYSELNRAGGMHTINEIARYSVSINQEHFAHDMLLMRTLEYLRRLASISRTLYLYLKRDVLPNRLTSLLDVDEALKRISSDLSRENASTGEHSERVLRGLDREILQCIVAQWTSCVTRELGRLRDKADLHITVEQRLIQMAEHISIPLVVHNNGHSPANHVELKLRKNKDFAFIGNNTRTFDSISTDGSQETSFTIKPFASSLHFIFELQYTDAEASDKVLTHSERIEIHTTPRPWTHIRNPYNSGTPIRDSNMFYGRQDDLRILREKLIDSGNNSMVVLSGQRRFGKTSILYQLLNTGILEPHVPVLIDMHGEGMEFTPARFFSHLSEFIYRALQKHDLSISPPDIRAIEQDPSFRFRLFLEDVSALLGNRKLVLLIDEFEILEEKMKDDGVAQEISKYFRSLMQHGEGTCFLLSGTRKIHEMTNDYWSVLFNIARQHRLSPLSERGAIQLITEPVQPYLQYDTSAEREIRQLTGDQPYFIHLLCGHLVDHCNEIEQSYVMLDDIKATLDKVLKTCHNHFTWMWSQLSTEEQRVLSAIAEADGGEGRPVSFMDIEDIYQYHTFEFDESTILQALEHLMKEEIIEGVVSGEITEIASTRMLCHIPVGLAHHWIRRTKPLKK